MGSKQHLQAQTHHLQPYAADGMISITLSADQAGEHTPLWVSKCKLHWHQPWIGRMVLGLHREGQYCTLPFLLLQNVYCFSNTVLSG